MARLTWTEDALTQLQEIAEYAARRSPARAAALYSRLEQAVEQLETSPLMGRVVPEFGLENLRELIRPPHRILYLVRGEECFIVAVIDSRRDIRNLVYPEYLDDLVGDEGNQTDSDEPENGVS